jgi:hypothetical protein
MGRTFAELTVDIPLAASDVDHAPNLGRVRDTIERLQHPALPRAIRREEKLVVHVP